MATDEKSKKCLLCNHLLYKDYPTGWRCVNCCAWFSTCKRCGEPADEIGCSTPGCSTVYGDND